MEMKCNQIQQVCAKNDDMENNAFWQSTLEEVVQCDEEDLDCP